MLDEAASVLGVGRSVLWFAQHGAWAPGRRQGSPSNFVGIAPCSKDALQPLFIPEYVFASLSHLFRPGRACAALHR